MTERSIVVTLPDGLFERVRHVAESSGRSLEAVILEGIEVLFQRPDGDDVDMDAALAVLSDYTDVQLWAVVYRRLTGEQSARLHELSATTERRPLTESEEAELASLLALVDRDMLLRSEALLLLKERGQDIEAYLKAPL